MTFTLTSKRDDAPTDQPSALAEQAARMLELIRGKTVEPARVVIETADDDAPVVPLTDLDIADLQCEGRQAAFEGRTLRSCPYKTASHAQRDAWMQGFHAGK